MTYAESMQAANHHQVEDSAMLKESEMFAEVMIEIRAIRKRLDDHIDDGSSVLSEIRRDLFKTREEMATHRTRLGIISSGIALLVAGCVSFLADMFLR